MRMRPPGSFTLLVLVGLCSGCNSNTTSEKPAQQASADAVQMAIQNVAAQLTQLSAQTERLTALIGDGSSAEKLTQFAVRIRTASAAELDGLGNEYESLRASLRPLEAAALVEKLTEIDWLIEVRRRLTAPVRLDQLLELEDLMQQVPRAFSGTIADGYLEQVRKAIDQFASDVKAKDPPDADELQAACDLLDSFEAQNTQVQESRAKLRTALAHRLETARQHVDRSEYSARLKSFNDDLTACRTLTDPDLRVEALMNLHHVIQNFRLQRAFERVTDAAPELADLQDQVAGDLEKIVQEQRAKQTLARMRYQKWTLIEIAKLKDFLDQEQVKAELYRLRDKSAEESGSVVVKWADFAGVRQLLQAGFGQLAENLELSPAQKEKIGPLIQEKWTQLIEQVRHDAAVRHLLHIDQNLLEPPVAKFYNEAFEDVWRALQDRSDLRLSLAQKTAEIQKRSLDAFLETGHE